MSIELTLPESERLTFRRMSRDDFSAIYEMLSDPEVMYAWERGFTRDETFEWIDRQLLRYDEYGLGYFLALMKSGEPLGQMGVMWTDIKGERTLEVGYVLPRRSWGKGYAREGVASLIEFAHTKLGVGTVYATIRTENKPSIAVAEAIGMTKTGEMINFSRGKSCPT